MSKLSKMWKIIISAAVALVLTIAIVAMVLFIPLNGKKNDYFWSYGDQYDISLTSTIEKKAGEEFKIMVIADSQLWMGSKDNKSALNMIKELADAQKPNLIVTVGDNVSGLFTDSLTKQLVKALDEIAIPWTVVFGNHDSEGKATLNWQGDRFMESEYSLFKKGPSNLYGSGNHVINIMENGKAVQSLFMLDNGRYYDYPESVKVNGNSVGTKEVWVGYEQMAWYEWNVKGLAASQGGEVVPSMTFTHFAPPEMREFFDVNKIEKSADDRYHVPAEFGSGSLKYLPGVAPVNSGFFDKALANGTTHMFFGHDHENDAQVNYKGMYMTYGLKTGPSPAPWNDALEYGATFITIGADNSVSVNNVVHSQAK